jgi:hypothetical protein
MNIISPAKKVFDSVDKNKFKIFLIVLILISCFVFKREYGNAKNFPTKEIKISLWKGDNFQIEEFAIDGDFVFLDFDQYSKLSRLLDKKVSIDLSNLDSSGEVSAKFFIEGVPILSHKRFDLSLRDDLFSKAISREYDGSHHVILTSKTRPERYGLLHATIIFSIGIFFYFSFMWMVLMFNLATKVSGKISEATFPSKKSTV